MDVSRETCSDVNVLQIVSHGNFCTDGISLFLSIMIMSTFRSWIFNENVCAIGIPKKGTEDSREDRRNQNHKKDTITEDPKEDPKENPITENSLLLFIYFMLFSLYFTLTFNNYYKMQSQLTLTSQLKVH